MVLTCVRIITSRITNKGASAGTDSQYLMFIRPELVELDSRVTGFQIRD